MKCVHASALGGKIDEASQTMKPESAERGSLLRTTCCWPKTIWCKRIGVRRWLTFELIGKVLTMAEVPKPSAEMIREGKNKGKTMIVKMEACSISMGDTYMLDGNCDLMLNPKLPFVPGMDICGVVEDIAEGSEDFKVGDRVIATNGMEPVGGMAEYAVVHTKFAGKAPPNFEPVQAAALPNSPIAAMDAVKAVRLKEGDRVMVLAGSGGVGSSLVQLARTRRRLSWRRRPPPKLCVCPWAPTS
ncbi:unnamed protein product [Scytosiphon promiscuus]